MRRLDGVVRAIVPGGRDRARDLIASVIAAGGVSEGALLAMARDESLGVSLRADVCWLLPRLAVEEAADALQALLLDPAERIREEAAAGLGQVARDDQVDALLAVAERDSSPPVRLAALHALGMLGSPRSARRLVRLLRDPDQPAEVRADAAEALAHVPGEGITGALIEALAGESPAIRYAAAFALGEQGDVAALPPLRDVAERDAATTPWGSVASCARESIEKLETLETRGR